jgi:hypothetical protein
MADNDVISLLQFAGVDDSNNATTYSSIRAVATDVSNNSESGSITFHTRNVNVFAERFSIASDGKTFIERTVSSTAEVHPALQIETTSTGTENSSFATGIDFFQDGVHKKRLAVTKGNSGTGGGDWAFYKDQGTTVHTYMTADGNMNIVDGDLVIGTAGHGIDFSATAGSGAGEILDDYEYGSWTPTLYGHLAGGNFTLTSAEGRYVKVGKCVSLWGYLAWSATGGNGVVNIAGIPFSTHNTAANNSAVTIGSRSGISYPRVVGQMYHTGYINLQYVDASAPYNSDNISVGALQSSGSLRFSWQYEAGT